MIYKFFCLRKSHFYSKCWRHYPFITAGAEDEGRGRAQARQSWSEAEGSGKGEVKEMNTVCGEVCHVTM